MRAMPLLLAVSLPSPVLAATLTVGPTQGEHRSIGAALESAADGDVIEIAPGTYGETLVIDRDVTLTGSGAELTTLAPTAGGAAITVTGGADVRIELLTLDPMEQGIVVEDGSALVLSLATVRDADARRAGAALLVRQGSEARVEATRFLDNRTTGTGGHVSVDGSRLEVFGSSFERGHARAGGAVQVTGESSAHLERVAFRDNRAARRGGAIIAEHSQVLVAEASFEANHAVQSGGAVQLHEGALDLLDVDLHGNASAEGAAIAIAGEHASFGAVDALFEGHAAAGNGGAIAVSAEQGDVSLGEVVFRGNQAERGGAIAVTGARDGVQLWIERSEFDGNTAAKGGGALWVDGAADLRLVGNAFVDNASDQNGGAIALAEVWRAEALANRFCENEAAWQGGAVHDRYSGQHRWANNRFTGNAAGTSGGAVAVSFPSFDALAGAPRGTGPSFVNNAFLRNEATTASALWLTTWTGFSGSYLDFRNNLVAWNEGYAAVMGEPGTMDATIGWNAFWRTDEPVLGFDDVFATLEVQPLLADDGCRASRLREDSPLVDAGDPALFDGDGTRSDIGPDGGPYADPEYVVARTDGGVIVRVPVDDAPDAPTPDEPSAGCTTAPAKAAWTLLLLPLLALGLGFQDRRPIGRG